MDSGKRAMRSLHPALRIVLRSLTRERRIQDSMTPKPRSIAPDTFALEALALLHQHAIDQLPVVDDHGRLIGLLDVQDLLNLKIG